METCSLFLSTMILRLLTVPFCLCRQTGPGHQEHTIYSVTSVKTGGKQGDGSY